MIDKYMGIKIVIKDGPEMVESHIEQIRFPNSKKKRIRKKWRSSSNNFRTVIDDYIAYHDRANNVLIMHPVVYRQLVERVLPHESERTCSPWLG